MSELSGIIKNALELGWSIPEIRESLINSGYTLVDIDAETVKFSQASTPLVPPVSLPVIPQKQFPIAEEKKTSQLQTYQLPKIPEKKHKGLKIFLILIAILFLGFLSIVIYAFITSLHSV